MKHLFALTLALLPFTTFASESPQLVRCAVTGAKLAEPAKLRDLLVDDGGTRVIAIALSEPADGGSYQTYAHLNLGLDRVDGAYKLTLNVSDTTGNIVGVKRDESRPLWARVSFPSRVKGPNMDVELSCEPMIPAYVLEPTYEYNVDPIYGEHFLATTIPFFHAETIWPSQSEGEYLASHYCLKGFAPGLVTDMYTRPSLWRTDASDHHTVLAPAKVNVTRDGSVQYEQRAQEVVCVKSHVEKQYNSDTGMEEDVTVCDQYQKNELAPVLVTIKACE